MIKENKPIKYQFLLFGTSGVGKTHFLNKLCDTKDNIPLIFLYDDETFKLKLEIEKQNFEITFIDTNGNRLDTFGCLFEKHIDAIIFMHDGTKENLDYSLIYLKQIINLYKRNIRMRNIKLFFFITKINKESVSNNKTEKVFDFCKENGIMNPIRIDSEIMDSQYLKYIVSYLTMDIYNSQRSKENNTIDLHIGIDTKETKCCKSGKCHIF